MNIRILIFTFPHKFYIHVFQIKLNTLDNIRCDFGGAILLPDWNFDTFTDIFRSWWAEPDLLSNTVLLFVVDVGVYGTQEREGEDAAVS